MESTLKDKVCLVTGSDGFVGSHIARRLVEEGAKVIPLNRQKGDATVYDEIELYFEGVDYVFNNVALANFQACLDNPVLCYKTNVLSAVNVLEASRKYNVKRVVLSSSNIVYYNNNPYQVAMKTVESIGKSYFDIYGLSTISLRYSNIYGKRPKSKYKTSTLIDEFIRSYKKNKTITVMGDGEQTRDYIYIDDVVQANLDAAVSSHTGHIDICTGKQISVNTIASYFNCEVIHTPPRKHDVRKILQSPIWANIVLDWGHTIDFDEGIRKLLKEEGVYDSQN